MNAKLEKIEKNVVSLEVEIESEKFAMAMEKAFHKVSKKVSIPGFRKGKAPKFIIERHVGKEYLKEEALDIILPEAYLEAVNETKIEPIDKPKVELIQVEEGQPLIFKATVEVKPEVELGQYIGLEVNREEKEVSEKDVEQELERLRERHAQIVNIEEGTAELKDTVIIDFEGFQDGVPFEGGAGNDYPLELGSGSFIPGFEEQLAGVSVGETKDVNVTFPENYHAENLAGKEATFKVTVKGIKRKELADLDDEFAKDVSEFDTLQELKEDILNRLKEAAKQEADYHLKDLLVDKAVEAAAVEVPEVMIRDKVDAMIQSFSQRLSMQGMKLEDYLKYTCSDLEALKADYRQVAEKGVKTDLVLEAIAAKENISADEEEIDAKVAEMAAQYNYEPGIFREWLENSGNFESVKKTIVVDKTVDFLQEKAVIK